MIAHKSKTRGNAYFFYLCANYLTHRDRTKQDFYAGTVYPIETIERAVATAIGQACETPQAISAALAAYRPEPTL
jgi:hypothetical protein